MKEYVYALEHALLDSLQPIDHTENSRNGQGPLSDNGSHDSSESDAERDEADLDPEAEEPPTQTRAGPAVTWFTSILKPPPSKFGVYSCLIPPGKCSVKSMQTNRSRSKDHQVEERTIAMFMMGGGHFAGAVVSITHSTLQNCVLRASKGFHRYTTRRKQGGSQSANDNAKGAAHSAGATLRRYNEQALQDDVHSLFREWKAAIDKCEIILIRAAGQTNRKVLFGCPDVLSRDDPRVRGFPINTRRATQSEIIRCFSVLSRLQEGSISPVLPKKVIKESSKEAKDKTNETIEPIQVEHVERIKAIIRRNKVPALHEYLQQHAINLDWRLEAGKSHGNGPTMLHQAARDNASHVVTFLLDSGADPTIRNDAGKTPFEVSGGSGRSVKDSFRIFRGRMEADDNRRGTIDWDAARIPSGLTEAQVETRMIREAEEMRIADEEEDQRRTQEVASLARGEAEAQGRQQVSSAAKRGKGRTIGAITESRMMADLSGISGEMKVKIEREKRARAAEARFSQVK